MMRKSWSVFAGVALSGMVCNLSGCTSGADGTPQAACVAGSTASCSCGDGRTLTTVCLATGLGYQPCACGAPVSNTGVAGTTPPPQNTGLGAGGASPAIGTGGATTGVGGRAAGIGGASGVGGALGLSGAGGAKVGTGGMTGGTGGGAAGAGSNSSGLPDAELEMLRQTCVDEINMYRAMLMLTPLKRGTPAQETCSDSGAQMDGDSGVAHQSARAGLCRSVGLGAEDTCPGWGIGGFSGNATVADALKKCLMSMWAEGPPPTGTTVAQCIADSAGCFQMHGHYLNMSGTSSTVVCSFYKMKTGSYWMNQDFGH